LRGTDPASRVGDRIGAKHMDRRKSGTQSDSVLSAEPGTVR
jgi:hypothetical protein